ncbi:MAG TPA: addiction module protein [Terriglobia bacterium]|nr:addiction module protein [Terriglobia bacterium]
MALSPHVLASAIVEHGRRQVNAEIPSPLWERRSKHGLEERLRLLDELWESLSRTPEAIPMTSAQRAELDRRLDELDRDGPIGIPWALHRPPSP